MATSTNSDSPDGQLSLVMTRRDTGEQRLFTAPVPPHQLFAALLSDLYDGESPVTVVRWERVSAAAGLGPWVIEATTPGGGEVLYDVAFARPSADDPAGLTPAELLGSKMVELGYAQGDDPVDLAHSFFELFREIADEIDLRCAPDSQFVLTPTYRVYGPWAPDVWPWFHAEIEPGQFDIHLEWEYSQPAWAPDAQQVVVDHLLEVVAPLADEFPLQVILGRPLADDPDDLAVLRAALPSLEAAGLVVGRLDPEEEDLDTECVVVVRHRVLVNITPDDDSEGDEPSVDLDESGDDDVEIAVDADLDDADWAGPASEWEISLPLDADQLEELLDHLADEKSPDDALEAVTGSRRWIVSDTAD